MDFDDAIVRTADLTAVGRAGELPRMLQAGVLLRVRSGSYADPATWRGMTGEARIRMRAQAVDARAALPQTFVGSTAAAVWGLPLRGIPDTRVHVLQREGSGQKSRGDIIRHAWSIPESDIVERDGVRVTTLGRTLYDVSRELPLDAAVACVDAGFRALAWRGTGRFDTEAEDAARAALVALIDDAGPARGIRQARFVADFADGRAQLPGESVSRLFMHRLGVEVPLLQHEVRIGGGRRAYPDFAWPRRRRFGEFDGDGKYVDPSMTGGLSVRATLREQRVRETAITEATGWLPVRWGWERLSSLSVFAAFLRAHDVLD